MFLLETYMLNALPITVAHSNVPYNPRAKNALLLKKLLLTLNRLAVQKVSYIKANEED